jgi:hypothetical protein
MRKASKLAMKQMAANILEHRAYIDIKYINRVKTSEAMWDGKSKAQLERYIRAHANSAHNEAQELLATEDWLHTFPNPLLDAIEREEWVVANFLVPVGYEGDKKFYLETLKPVRSTKG